MAVIGGALGITWLIGMFVAVFVLPWRVGLNHYAWAGAFMQPGSRRNGIPWAIKAYFKLPVWPLVLAYWLAQGRPGSPVLFGPEAAEQLYDDPSRAMPGFMTKWRAR
jgi:hypothetical protein